MSACSRRGNASAAIPTRCPEDAHAHPASTLSPQRIPAPRAVKATEGWTRRFCFSATPGRSVDCDRGTLPRKVAAQEAQREMLVEQDLLQDPAAIEREILRE